MDMATITVDEVWTWLGEVRDPEIPALSIVDLGIVRAVAVDEAGACTVTITPTYSGCPAMTAITEDIVRVLAAHGLTQVRVARRLAPAWTTDWMSEAGKAALLGQGIAPPGAQMIDTSGLVREPAVACPRCGSTRTRLLSRFGSTPCKALHQCLDCREPYDHFKPH
jgi:ring-1,2-phenylacetyl-CoA epoxidase subunit PaaD